MRFLIATGIYPPEIGGPAYYAKNLAEALEGKGHKVDVGTFGNLKELPTGIRHLALFFKMIPVASQADVIIALDTFSAALPAYFAAALFRKKLIVRTGGDFLWEQYIERTGDPLPLPFFYEKHLPFTRIENIYLSITRFIVERSFVVFSTQFQKSVWINVFKISESKTSIIPNAITGMLNSKKPAKQNFLAYGRDVKLRNREVLKKAFEKAKVSVPDIELEIGQLPQHVLFERIENGYCLILPSVSDISPNYILDGLRAGKPFIMTKYSEYAETYKDFGFFVDPLDENDIAEKIVAMSDKATYDTFVKKIKAHVFSRTYAELADDFILLAKRLIK